MLLIREDSDYTRFYAILEFGQKNGVLTKTRLINPPGSWLITKQWMHSIQGISVTGVLHFFCPKIYLYL